MKFIEGFKLRPLGREFIVVGEGLAQVNFNKMISLNETAAYLWETLQGREFTVDDMVKALCEKYEVTEELASTDSAKLAEDWINAGLVER